MSWFRKKSHGDVSRRSFLVDVASAGAGLLLASKFLAGCGNTPKYGGPPQTDSAVYGGPDVRAEPDTGSDTGPVAKYGGPRPDQGTPDMGTPDMGLGDTQPVVKYGGPAPDASTPDGTMATKYGGPGLLG